MRDNLYFRNKKALVTTALVTIGGLLFLLFWEYVVIARRASHQMTRASQKSVYTDKFLKNFKRMYWKYIGKRLSHFQYRRCQLPIYFQHIPINFDVIGKMYGFLTGTGT